MLIDESCFRRAAFAAVVRVTGVAGVGEGVGVTCDGVEDA
jgi:hypothetical protein